MKLMLWDIDLTLIRTGGAGLKGLDRAFRSVFGWEAAMDRIHPQGKTDPAIIREVCVAHGLDDDTQVLSTVDRILAIYLGFLEEEVRDSDGYEILPGIRSVLDELAGCDDIVVGLATGNVESGARIKLERGGLNAYFPFGGFGGVSEERVDVVRAAARNAESWAGTRFAVEDIFVIGDTPNDVDAGRRAGFRTVAVATGHTSVGELEATGADLVIDDFESGRGQFMRSTRME